MTQAPASRLDALTSLRFVAALMIVLFHTLEGFGRAPSMFNLAQGVSFFYVLSGFILTLVYPRLEGAAAVRRFWRARFARVWPAYVVALAVGFWLVDYPVHAPSLVAYVAMVQAWIPVPAYYFGYNAVGWSVSTEWFFYLAFPLLVAGFARTWHWKLAAAFGLVVALAWLCSVVDLTDTGRVVGTEAAFLVNRNGVMFIQPLSRVFEFVAGMCVALAWRRYGAATPAMATGAATLLELAVLAACVAAVYFSAAAGAWNAATLGEAFASWFHVAGSTPVFGALIYVMALGRGGLSRVLAWRPFVVLGEISFSVYLLHQLLFFAYLQRAQDMPQVPQSVAYALYLGIVLLASYVTWRFVEMPARRLIVGGELHGSSVVTAPTRTARIGARVGPALAAVALVAATLALDAVTARPVRVAVAPLPPAVLAARGSPRSCNIEFADDYRFEAGVPIAVESRHDIVRLSGWFLSEFSGRPGEPASLRLLAVDGVTGWTGPIDNWTPRPDVLRVMQAVGEGLAGFAQRIDVSDVPPGTYRLAIVFRHAGKDYACDVRRELVVGGG